MTDIDMTDPVQIIALELAARAGGSIALRHDLATAKAMIAALGAQGFKILPREPTSEMKEAVAKQAVALIMMRDEARTRGVVDVMCDRWRQMWEEA